MGTHSGIAVYVFCSLHPLAMKKTMTTAVMMTAAAMAATVTALTQRAALMQSPLTSLTQKQQLLLAVTAPAKPRSPLSTTKRPAGRSWRHSSRC